MSLSRLRPACTCLFAARQATLPFVGHSAIPSRYIRRQRWQSTTRPGNAAYLADSAKASPLQSTSSSATSQPGKRSFGTAVAVGAFGLIAGYGLCVLYPPGWYRLLFPLPAPIAPAADTPEGVALVRQIEGELQNLDIVKQLREEYINPATGQLLTTSPYTTSLTQDQTSRVKRWKESRPYSRMPESKKRHSLTQFSLRGPGKFAVNPLVFASLDEKETIAIVHVGNGMCGHNGIVHGGLLATLLDEAVARPAFFALPNNIGMTVYLNVRYKAPTLADQFLVVKTRLKSVSGRKAFVEGEIYDILGKRLVECDALYVEPKEAWMLKSSAVKEAMAEA